MTQTEPASAQPGEYVQANGLNIYYEVYGEGEPLLLLHGGTETGKSWEPYLSTFGRHFQIIVPDSRGHGKTNNPSQEFSYRAMADDIASLIQGLGLKKPFICGYSDGGQIALEIGMRYPDVARGLVVSAAFYKFSKSYLNALQGIGMESPGVVNVEYVERELPQVVALWRESHVLQGPDYWKTLLRQLSRMYLTPLDYTVEDFKRVIVPTLILVGDRDSLVPVEQAVEMYRLIPPAELAIGPNADHFFPMAKAELFRELVLDFLLRHRMSADQT